MQDSENFDEELDDLSDVPIESLYQILGNYIVNSLDVDWLSASLFAEINDEDSGKVYGRYTTKQGAGEKPDNFRADYTVYLVFDEIRKRIRKDDLLPWNKARFVLKPDGQFTLNFEYPDQ